ncbi:MAG: amidohydrolase family protein, partial [Anaerolineae bacterium]
IVPIAWGEYPTCSEVNDAYYSSYFGAEPMPWLENWRAFLDANPNLPAAWHTDFPYAAINPFLHLYSYVTRQEVDADGTVCLPPDWLAAHRITVDEALPMMTINGAYALFRDEEVGSLKARKYADLIIISDDPTTIDPNDLINIQVQMTMVGGQTAFCAEGQADLCPQGGTAVPPAATPTPPPAAAPGITASAFLATDPPENAFDGSPDTAWISGGDAPQWIAIDLGEPTAVSGIRLTVAMYPDGRTTHRVYGKTPDGDYQLLHEFQGDTVDGQVLSYIPPEPWADIQFIKVETTATPSWVAWKEIVIETP